MSATDIILIILGVAVVVIYAILAIKRTKGWQSRYRQLIKEGKTEEQAKIIADREYFAKKAKKQNQENEEEETFEE